MSCGEHSHPVSLSGSATGKASAESHKHNFTVPTHSHDIKLPGHSHKFTVPAHSHDIKMPPHTHELVYGIYENNSIPACKVYLDTTDLGINMSEEKTYQKDITEQFSKLTPGFHYIEIKTTSSTGLARAAFTLFWSGYFNYKS